MMKEAGSPLEAGSGVALGSADERGTHLGGVYLRQLDTLRAAAVGVVIVSHWAPGLQIPGLNGILGVRLFFVISGFLITGILLRARHDAAALGTPRRRLLRSFYLRRALRILPLFYATLLVTWLLGFPNVRLTLPWHVLYSSNILFSLRGEWFAEVSHFWSLAVEEQFYLVWPLFLIFLPRRAVPWFMAGSVLLAFLYRIAGQTLLGLNDVTLVVLPFASLDMVGIGGLCAYLQAWDARRLEVPARWVAVAGAVAWVALRGGSESLLFVTMRDVVRVLTLAAIVVVASNGIGGWIGTLFSLRPLVYLGRISYSLYLFHPFVPILTLPLLAGLNPRVQPWVNLVVLIAASALSWRFFEGPINHLKRHFPYVPQPQPAGDTLDGAVQTWLPRQDPRTASQTSDVATPR